jgi:anthranilate synthase component 2
MLPYLLCPVRILLLDNYDSFTYNLFHYLEQCADTVVVARNDEISIEDAGEYDGIVLSPGPGLPKDAGIMPELIRTYSPTKPILGVCLGMQAIGEAFGAGLRNLAHPLHGVDVPITVCDTSEPLFQGLPARLSTGRYHSWVVDRATMPDVLRITATDDHGELMALRHTAFPVCGVQFHPESLLTPHGMTMIRNWVADARMRA